MFEKVKVKTSGVKQDFLTCTKCDYKSKKEAYLKKHIITKHEKHVCKECKETFNSFMELLKHIVKDHNIKPDEATEKKVHYLIVQNGKVIVQNGEEDTEIKKDKPM